MTFFSSEPTIFLEDPQDDFEPESFITLDPPKHDQQRKVVNPAVAPVALKDVEGLIRQRTQNVLDSLPVGETFNWVDAVSIELTTQMLATLFDFPFEDRHKLIRWSDLTTIGLQMGLEREQIIAELMECHHYFARLLQERMDAPPRQDFISLMAHDPVMAKQQPMELLGNLMLLIVGGNDTTRNSMSGGVLALNQHPAEYQKLMNDPALIPNMVSEVIRWQTPLAYMRRTALKDFELRGKQIKQGDRVLMWYISGNRDERVIERPDEFLIDRPDARRHISFGFGIHRCMGNRLAEMQLRVLWEEILARFEKVEVVGEPAYTPSFFVHGITDLPVRLIPR